MTPTEEVDTGMICLFPWPLAPPVCEEDRLRAASHACIRKIGHYQHHLCSCGETHE